MTISRRSRGTHRQRTTGHRTTSRSDARRSASSRWRSKTTTPRTINEADAADAGYPALLAPLTFLAVAGRRVQLEIFTKFNIPINIARVVHRDQKFRFHRPIVANDKLYFDTYLDAVIESHGTVIAEIRSEVTDAEGKPIVTSVVTMLGEAHIKKLALKKPSPP